MPGPIKPDPKFYDAIVSMLRRYMTQTDKAGGSLPMDKALVEKGLARARKFPEGWSDPDSINRSVTRTVNDIYPEVQSRTGGQTGPDFGMAEGDLENIIKIFERFYGPGRGTQGASQ